MTKIEDGCFASCSSLPTISLPEGIVSIGDNAFYNCTTLTTALLPNSLETIGESSFRYCSKLQNITLPEHINKIGNDAFSNCIVSGAIKVGEGLSADNHGGITGFSNSELKWCINSASVTGAGSNHGGICGRTTNNSSLLYNNLNTGVVEGTSYVGSIVGYNQTPLYYISPAPYKNNYHTSNTTGSIGGEGSTTGTDVNNDDLVFEITAADGLTLTLPTPTYTWGNKSLFNRGTQVTISLTVPEGKYFDRYTVDNGTISNPFIIDGSHQLTNQTGDVVISASLFDGQANLATAASIADIAAQTYNGAAYRPLPVVTYDGRTLVKDLHYTVSYSEGCTNADTYTVTVTGMGSYSGQLTKDYVINPFDISTDDAVTVTGVDAEYKQTSYAIHPQPVVTCAALNNTTLVEGTDYDLSYSEGCTLPGDYNVILTGKGNYTGVKNVPFTILDEFIDLYVGIATHLIFFVLRQETIFQVIDILVDVYIFEGKSFCFSINLYPYKRCLNCVLSCF